MVTDHEEDQELKELEPGKGIGNHTIHRKIGRGYSGVVYEALNNTLKRIEAIKVMRPKDFGLLIKEGQTIAQLDHPNIVKIIHLYDESYFSMKYVEGGSFSDRLSHPIPVASILDVATQVSYALEHAHRLGIGHRDIKPSNVLMGDNAQVCDFGFAKILGKGKLGHSMASKSSFSAAGTEGFMAPEQKEGHFEFRSDLYSLAALMYVALTGKLPIGKFSLSMQHPDLPQNLVDLVEMNLAQNPNERSTNATEFRSRLESLLGDPLNYQKDLIDAHRIISQRVTQIGRGGYDPGKFEQAVNQDLGYVTGIFYSLAKMEGDISHLHENIEQLMGDLQVLAGQKQRGKVNIEIPIFPGIRYELPGNNVIVQYLNRIFAWFGKDKEEIKQRNSSQTKNITTVAKPHWRKGIYTAAQMSEDINQRLANATTTANEDFDGATVHELSSPEESISVGLETLARGSHIIDANKTFRRGKIYVPDDILVGKGAMLTIEPGTELYMGTGKRIIIKGEMLAEGESDKKIIITAQDNYFGGINFLAGSGGNSFLKYCDISKAGDKSDKVDISDDIEDWEKFMEEIGKIRLEGKLGGIYIHQRFVDIQFCEIHDCSGDKSGTASAIEINSDSSSISNNRIFNNRAAMGGAILVCGECASGKVVIFDNHIYQNHAGTGGGIYLGGFAIVRDNHIYGNTSYFGAAGITALMALPEIRSNQIYNNKSDLGTGGISLIGCNPILALTRDQHEKKRLILVYNKVTNNTGHKYGGLELDNSVVAVSGNHIKKNQPRDFGKDSESVLVKI